MLHLYSRKFDAMCWNIYLYEEHLYLYSQVYNRTHRRII